MESPSRKPMPPKSPFVTETLAEMQRSADDELFRLLSSGEAENASKVVSEQLVPIDTCLAPRLGA